MSLSIFSKRSLTFNDAAWLGESGSEGVWLNAERAVRLVPVYAAVKLISETIASLPLHAYSTSGAGRRRIDLPRVFAQPGDGSTTFGWVQRAMVSLLLHGNAYGYVTSWNGGWPSGIVWLNPDRVTCEGHALSAARYTVDGNPVDPMNIVHIPALSLPGRAAGLSPIRAFALTFDAGHEAQKANRQWAKNRAVPSLTLKNNARALTDVQSEAIEARAEDRIRTGRPFVYGKDWDFGTVSMPAADAAFIDSIKASANQVAAIFTMPPELIGGMTGGPQTYNTVEGQLNWLLTMTTRSWVTNLEAVWSSRCMPRPQYVKFTTDAVVRTDLAVRMAAYKTGREIGLYSLDEIRAMEDREPLPDGQGSSFAPLAVQQKQQETAK